MLPDAVRTAQGGPADGGRRPGVRWGAAGGAGCSGGVGGGVRGGVGGGVGDALVVADHLGDDEVEEFLGERGVEFGALGEAAQPGDLAGLPLGVGRGQPVRGLEMADLLGALEAFGEHVDDGGVDVVDAVAQPFELGVDRGIGPGTVAGGHGRTPYGAAGVWLGGVPRAGQYRRVRRGAGRRAYSGGRGRASRGRRLPGVRTW
jgi:hypothetical protein